MVHEAAGHGMGYLAMPELPDYDQLQRRLNIANELAAKSTSGNHWKIQHFACQN